MDDSEIRKTIEDQVLNLADLIRKNYSQMEHIGVLGGKSGLALFEFYCAKYFNDDNWADVGEEILISCQNAINEGYSLASYAYGIAGYGWSLLHLVEKGFIIIDSEELLDPLDKYLLAQMKYEIQHHNLDFLHGAMGYGFYFLKRYQCSTTKKNKYLEILENLVVQIKKMAIREGNGIKWEAIIDVANQKKVFNLGLSHGMGSIIYLLSKISFNGILQSLVNPLIEEAVNYILKHEASGKGVSLFPNWIEPDEPIEYNSRVAWCYGDLGIAYALSMTGELLGNYHYTEKAYQILQHTSKRKYPQETFVVDSGFCHGSFGNFKLFHNLNKKYSDEGLRKAAEFWLSDGLNKTLKDNNSPYQQYNYFTNSWKFEVNLLEGISGIGLTLVDYLSNDINEWDECLMLT